MQQGGAQPCILADLLLRLDGRAGIHFITGSQQERFRSYHEITADALSMLAALQARGVSPRTCVAIAVADPEAFVLSFWACVLGGFVPVPVQSSAVEEHRLKLQRILELLDDPFLISDAPSATASASAAELLSAGLAPAAPCGTVAPDDLAFVQFSSGSTGHPKGVALTHGQLILHFADYAASAELGADDVFLSWFPLTHDMGLIGWHLIPLSVGATHCLLPTKLFVQRPALWLSKAAEHKAGVLCTNNFGLKHFLKLLRPDGANGWDLTRVRALYNAAEPISADLCEEFLARMAPAGLARNAFLPGYGLAEAALGVTFPPPGDGPHFHTVDRHRLSPGDAVRPAQDQRDEVVLAEVGRPIQGVRLRIAGDGGSILPDRTIGSVEVLSRSMARSYYANPEATAGMHTADGWLRTGDLGFLSAGRLVLTGRTKDLVIQAGANYYPHDLERLAEAVPGIEMGRVVATGIPDPAAQRERLVIFVQTRDKAAAFLPTVRAVRAALLRKGGLLVDHVLPIRYVPKTTSGKIERYRLARQVLDGQFDDAIAELDALEQAATPAAGWRTAQGAERRRLLLALVRQGAEAVLDLPAVLQDRSLFEQGMDSRRAVAMLSWLSGELGSALPVSLLFEKPTPDGLADAVLAIVDGSALAAVPVAVLPPAAHPPVAASGALAIIGMGCRFPGGANRPDLFWDLLLRETDATGPLPLGRGRPRAPVHGGFLGQVDQFDPGFFHLARREAEAIDPQARLLLEVCWEALEDAGLDVPALAGSETGVFVGVTSQDYALAQLHNPDPSRIGPYAYTGTSPSTAAGRVSHVLGLQGPAIALDTACSSSLVALHQAAEGIRSGDCTMALVAGVNLMLTPAGHVTLGQLGALSLSNVCRPFGDAADGYVRGEGCGVVVLKLLSQAQADGDRIHAVVLGSAVNHDGRSAGLTVPSGPAQAKVISRALARAGLAPDAIGYVEAHGTGTSLGDPVEARALDAVFGGKGSKGGRGVVGRQKLPVGSVKGNLGHLEAAAGMAGLIKAALALRHGVIPRSLHADVPSRHLPWSDLSIRLASKAEPWPEDGAPRRAGVSAFGMAGTNAHVVLQAAPEMPATVPSGDAAGIMPVSAASPAALRAVAAQWADLVGQDGMQPGVVAAAAARRRGMLVHRAVVRFDGRNSLLRRLRALAANDPAEGVALGQRRSDRTARLGFVFSGQGSQWAGMGAQMIASEPAFHDAVTRCDAVMAPLCGWSVLDDLRGAASEEVLARTDRAQAAIFAVQYALTTLLAHYGVVPDCVVGHSCGEIAALHAAGVLTLEQACHVVLARGRHMQAVKADGVMLAVRGPQDILAPLLSDDVEISAINSPTSTVLSTGAAGMEGLVQQLNASGLAWRQLDVLYAFHSGRMTDAADALAADLTRLHGAVPSIPVYSTSVGRQLRPGEPNAAWWRANVRAPVRFADAVAAMQADETTHFLEVSPHPVLSHAVADCVEGGNEAVVLGTLRRGSGQDTVHDALGALFAGGFDLRWDRLHPAAPLPEGLPLYPWQRVRLWPDRFDPWSDAGSASAAAESATVTSTPQGASGDRYGIEWEPLDVPAVPAMPGKALVIAAPTDPLSSLAGQIGAELCVVDTPHIASTLEAALRGPARPSRIVLLLQPPRGGSDAAAHRDILRRFLSTLLPLVRGAGAQPALWLVAPKGGPDGFGPDAAWALARTAAAEHPELGCRRVLLGTGPGPRDIAALTLLLGTADLADAELVIRDGQVYAARLNTVPAVAAPAVSATRPLVVRNDATYLVLGGTGSVGLVFAQILADRGARTLVLAGRHAASPDLRQLEAAGVRVHLRTADAADPHALAALMQDIDRTLPPLAGVVHAAGVLHDGTVAALDLDDSLAGRFGDTLRPKLDGGIALHATTQGRALDFMLLVSSAAAMLGSAGQGAYAAANGFLDALAVWRNSHGQPTLSLQLGLVEGSAMLRRAQQAGQDVEALGMPPLARAALAAALPALWQEGTPVVTFMALRPQLWAEQHDTPALRTFLGAFLGADKHLTLPRATPDMAAASVDGLRAVLRDIVAAVTHTPAAQIATDQPLRELGVDSLMTLQIRDRVRQRLGVAPRIADFWSYPTVDAFARHLAARLDTRDDAGEAAAKTSMAAPPPATPSVEDALADKWAKYL